MGRSYNSDCCLKTVDSGITNLRLLPPPKGSGFPPQRNLMNTLDMMKQAKIDGKTYQYDSNLFYAFGSGFMNADGEPSECCDLFGFTLNDVLLFQWDVVQTMTRKEAEERFGVKIVG